MLTRLHKKKIEGLIQDSPVFSSENHVDFLFEFEILLKSLERDLNNSITNLDVNNIKKIRRSFFITTWKKIETETKKMLVHILKSQKISTLKINNWIGPQSIWKWAITRTINLLLEIFTRDNLAKINILKDTQKSDISKIMSLISWNEKEEIVNFLLKITWEAIYEIKTWTGWIMRPSSDSYVEKRYEKYIQFERHTEDITGQWCLFENSWVNGMVMMELIYWVFTWNTSFSLDAWPRTTDQLNFLNTLINESRQQDINIDSMIFHLEPIVTSNFFQNKWWYFASAVLLLWELIVSFMEQINNKHIWFLEKYRIKYLPNAAWIIPSESLIYYHLSEEILNFYKKNIKSTNQNNQEAMILLELINWISELLKRVWNRVYSKNRKDDLDYLWYLQRLSIYYSETFPIGIRGDNILGLPVWGNYDLAIKNQIESLLGKFDENISNNWRDAFIKVATLIYLSIVTI